MIRTYLRHAGRKGYLNLLYEIYGKLLNILRARCVRRCQKNRAARCGLQSATSRGQGEKPCYGYNTRHIFLIYWPIIVGVSHSVCLVRGFSNVVSLISIEWAGLRAVEDRRLFVRIGHIENVNPTYLNEWNLRNQYWLLWYLLYMVTSGHIQFAPPPITWLSTDSPSASGNRPVENQKDSDDESSPDKDLPPKMPPPMSAKNSELTKSNLLGIRKFVMPVTV